MGDSSGFQISFYYTSFQAKIQVFPEKNSTGPVSGNVPYAPVPEHKDGNLSVPVLLFRRDRLAGQGIQISPSFISAAYPAVGKCYAVAVTSFVHGHDRDFGEVSGINLAGEFVSFFHGLSPVWVKLYCVFVNIISFLTLILHAG
jgi:hypothetical protein